MSRETPSVQFSPISQIIEIEYYTDFTLLHTVKFENVCHSIFKVLFYAIYLFNLMIMLSVCL